MTATVTPGAGRHDHVATEASTDQTVAATPTAPPADAPPSGFAAGNPAAVGVPVFVAGTVALALALVGYVPAASVGAALPIILAATGLGLTVATLWSAALGQTAVAAIFAIFAGFWLSYAVLVLGLTHNWFGVTADAVVHTQALFLITWLVVIGLLTLATLHLPLAFTVLFALIDLCLVVLLVSTLRGSAGWTHLGGWVAFAFAAVGAYLFVGIAAEASGGRALPLGRPVAGR